MLARTTACRRLGRACPYVRDNAEQGPDPSDLAIVTPDRVLLLALLVLALGWGVWRLRLRWRRGPAEPPASARSGARVPLPPPADDDVLEVAGRRSRHATLLAPAQGRSARAELGYVDARGAATLQR